MSERTVVLMGTALGAVLGAATGFLFFTERGRTVRDRLEPAVDDFRRELVRFQRTVGSVGDMALDGMRMLDELSIRPEGTTSASH